MTATERAPRVRADEYARRAAGFEQQSEARARRSRLVSNLRGLAFGVGVIGALVALFGATPGAGWLAAVAAVVFVVLVFVHPRVLEAEDAARRLGRVNRDAQARCEGKWNTLADTGERFSDETHPFAGDLDLFGPGSLFQRINVAHTYFGQEALAGFFRTPASVGEIAARQEAVRALMPELELRQTLEAASLALVEKITTPFGGGIRITRSDPPDPAPFIQWAEGAPTLRGRAWLVVAAHVLPPVTLAAIALANLGWVPSAVWAGLLGVQILVSFSGRAAAFHTYAALTATGGAFVRYGPMLQVVEGIDVAAERVRQLRERVLSSDVRASAEMRRFQRLVSWFELRENGLVHPFINALLLWDIHCVLRLEAWQLRAGRHVRAWFEAIGAFEALSSLAGFAGDDPECSWPEVEAGPAHFIASGLGHPLIEPDRRVVNDVSLLGPGRALLITGSNMSGKSTLLRAMGVAAVLAQSGGPVCARRLRMSPVALRTSIRVRDSLEQGVSHFYAELRKLKSVVEATAQPTPVLFLLDEILHGTNSLERQVGARWLLGKLLVRGALGAVSTHDMELCRLPEPLMSQVDQFHLRETVLGDEMTFDFTLRPGPVQGGNALRLMRQIGLDVPIGPGPDPDSAPRGDS